MVWTAVPELVLRWWNLTEQACEGVVIRGSLVLCQVLMEWEGLISLCVKKVGVGLQRGLLLPEA